MNCCNLISLDLGYSTSISSLHFVRHMPSLRELDITSCQNITLESLVTSLYKKNTLEILRMPNCFQVGGISLVSVVKSLPDIKIVNASGCETISVIKLETFCRIANSPNFLFPLTGITQICGNDFSLILNMSSWVI